MVNSLIREKILLLLVLLLVASTISGLPTLHASGSPGPGTVCLVDSSAVSSLSPPGPCSTGPYTFDAPNPSSPQRGPTQIRVGVYINGSGALGGFTVILNATHTILKAAGVDFTDSVLQTPSGPPQIFAECLDLILVKGPACNGADGLDTLGLSAGVALGGANTVAPTTGLLFTAIFNVTSDAGPSGVPISFQQNSAFCSVSSTSQASQPGNYCVSVTQPPSTTPIAETVLTGTVFNNNACMTTCTVPWVAVGSNVTHVDVIQGATTGLGVSITATPENAWPGLSSDSITFTAVVTPSTFDAPTFVGGVNSCSPGGTGTPLCPLTLTVSARVAGTYSVTVYGTYVAFDTTGVTDTLVGTESFVVNVGSVAWTINGLSSGSAQSLYMAKGVANPMGLLFTAQSLGGYSGTITYASSIAPAGFIFGYPPTFTLNAGATVTKTINVTAANYGQGLYKAKITASGLSVPASGILTIHVTGVSMSTNSSSVTFPAGGAAHISLTVNSLPASSTGFAGSVTVSNIVGGPAGSGRLTLSCPASISLGAGGSNSGTCTFAGNLAGTYSVTVKISAGANNAITNSTIVTAMIQAGTGPGINLSANPASITNDVSNPSISTITVASRNGLTGTVDLLVTVTGTATCSLNPTSITFGTSSTSVLSCNDSVPETVTATVTATNHTNTSITNSTDISYTFQDFAITANPTSVPVDARSAGTSTINTMGLNGFSGGIDLASNSTSCALVPTRLIGSGSASLSCTFSMASTIHVVVMGTNGTLSHSVTVTFTVHDFAITANPTSVPASVGANGVSTITVSSLNGFAGTVALTIGENSTNLSCNLSSTSLPGGSGSSTLSCSASVGGNYNATVTGTSGTLVHSVSVIYHVSLAPDFSIGANPTIVSVNVGAKGNSTITVSGFNSFNGLVSLSSNSTLCTLSPASLTGSGSATLSCTFSAVSTANVNVTGTSGGSLSHSVIVTYTVQDFTMSANPTTVTVNVNTGGASTITVAPRNGFTRTVNLSFTMNSTNLSCTLIPLSVSGGSGTSSLNCSSAIAGHYLATVTGVNGTLSHSFDVVYHVVNAPTFTVTASQGSVIANSGVRGTSTITVTPLNGFTGVVALGVVTNSTSLSCTLSPTSIAGGSGSSTLSCSSSAAGNYQANVTGTNSSVSPTPAPVIVTYHVQDFTVATSTASIPIDVGLTGASTITIAPLNGFAGTVNLSVSILPSTGLTGSFSQNNVAGGSGTSTLTLSAKTSGNYTVTVTAVVGTLSHTSTLTAQVGDFEITQPTSTITLNETTTGTFTLTFASTNGFNGQIDLVGYSCLLRPVMGGTLCVPYSGALPTASPNPATFNLSPGTSVDVQITVVVSKNVIPNLWGVGVNATVGSHSVVHPIELVVPQPIISIVSSPTSVVVGPGVNASMSVTITSLYGLNGTVTLALGSLTGASCSLSQNSVTLSKGGSTTTSIACSGSVGSYNETITGTGTAPYGSSVSKNGYAGFSVVDFTLTPTPSGGIEVNPGQIGHARIAIAWPGSYNGIVHFTIVPSSGLNASLSSASITGSGVLNVTVSSNLGGSYTLVVNATTGPVVNGVMMVAAFHVTRLTVTVLSPSPAGNILGLDPTTFYSIVGLLVVVVAVSALVISRRGRASKKKR